MEVVETLEGPKGKGVVGLKEHEGEDSCTQRKPSEKMAPFLLQTFHLLLGEH